jgi:hypothetical protein
MRKLYLTLIAATGLLATGSVAHRVDAAALGQPGGLRAALEDVAVAEQIHCRPGRLHHNWVRGRYRSDGCGVGIGVGPVIVVPPIITPRPRRCHRPYSSSWRPC